MRVLVEEKEGNAGGGGAMHDVCDRVLIRTAF
jgi:hypothetical protein